jgi:hypothetical protein
MSDTPRTDAEEAQQTQRYGCFMVKSDFARQLERELNAADERIADLEAGSIHSCHDQCQRIECVLRRRVAELEQELAVSKNQFEAMALSFTDKWRRLAELEKDKERLDWLNESMTIESTGGTWGGEYVEGTGVVFRFYSPSAAPLSFRERIDVARTESCPSPAPHGKEK